MEQPRNQNQTEKTPPERKEVTSYLNHGAESLVAMDNPDDSQLGTDKAPKRGSRR